jgi:hypothetical protein
MTKALGAGRVRRVANQSGTSREKHYYFWVVQRFLTKQGGIVEEKIKLPGRAIWK